MKSAVPCSHPCSHPSPCRAVSRWHDGRLHVRGMDVLSTDPLAINIGACCYVGSTIVSSCGGWDNLGTIFSEWFMLTFGFYAPAVPADVSASARYGPGSCMWCDRDTQKAVPQVRVYLSRSCSVFSHGTRASRHGIIPRRSITLHVLSCPISQWAWGSFYFPNILPVVCQYRVYATVSPEHARGVSGPWAHGNGCSHCDWTLALSLSKVLETLPELYPKLRVLDVVTYRDRKGLFRGAPAEAGSRFAGHQCV